MSDAVFAGVPMRSMVHRFRTCAVALILTASAPSLLAGGTESASAQAAPATPTEWVVKDAVGDVHLFGFTPPPPVAYPSNPGTDAHDITTLRIRGENEEGFWVELQMADLRALPARSPGGVATPQYYNVTFKLENVPVTYRLAWAVSFPSQSAAPRGTEPTPTRFCISPRSMTCAPQRIVGTIDWDQSSLVSFVPKDALIGRLPVPAGTSTPLDTGMLPASIDRGSKMIDIAAHAQDGPPTYMADDVPDKGLLPYEHRYAGPFTFQLPHANLGIRISAPHAKQVDAQRTPIVQDYQTFTFPIIGATPGSMTFYHVQVENPNEAKRLVRLRHEILGDDPPKDWGIRLLDRLTVPGGQSRLVNLIIQPSPNVRHGESALIRIKGESLGFPNETASLTMRLVAAAAPLAPNLGNLFFHARNMTETSQCGDVPCCRVLNYCTNLVGWMNTLEQDAAGWGDTGQDIGFTIQSDGQSRFKGTFTGEVALAEDLVLEPSRQVEMRLALKTQASTPGTLTVYVLAGTAVVAQHTGSVDLNGPGGVTIGMALDPTYARILAGTTLRTDFEFRFNAASVGAVGAAAGSARFVPRETKVTLPVISDTAPKERIIPAGPAVIGLTSDASNDMVNPGKWKLFNATLVNEGVQEDVFHVEASRDPQNWSLELKPGDEFRLPPGESVRMGVLVRPPEDAKEGDWCAVTLNVTSEADEFAKASLNFALTATTGVELADERDNYVADDDATQRLNPGDGKGTPGADGGATIAVMSCVSLLAWLGRMRRTRRE